MIIKKIEPGYNFSNTYLVISDDNTTSMIVDPSSDSIKIKEAVKDLNVVYIINTHGHFDHIGGNNFIKTEKKSSIVIHHLDAGKLTDPKKNLSLFSAEPVVSKPADIEINDENYIINLNELSFQVLHFPGHTEGCIAIYRKENNILISGDFIFHYAVGRTDLPGGNTAKMKESIKKVVNLPDETMVYPGHEEAFLLKDFKTIYRHFI